MAQSRLQYLYEQLPYCDKISGLYKLELTEEKYHSRDKLHKIKLGDIIVHTNIRI